MNQNDQSLWHAFSKEESKIFQDIKRTFVKSKNQYLTDSEGRKYFDGFSTLWTNLIGHGRREIAKEMYKQSKDLSFMHLFTGSQHLPAIELSTKLIVMTSGRFKKVFFGLSGSDATETSIKLARNFWKKKGMENKNIIVGRLSEYHGTTYGALALMGWDGPQENFLPVLPRTNRLPAPNCFHCPYSKVRSSCNLECARAFEEYFSKVNARENVAAILIEPIISSDGLITPPIDYWNVVENSCRKHDVLIIADEVTTGMGRTGTFLASDHYGLNPDIVYMSKGLTGGYAPLSATLVSEQIFSAIADKTHFKHGFTFGGHPISCVAALEVLKILDKENLISRAYKIEAWIYKYFDLYLKNSNRIAKINGKGALFEIELIKDKKLNLGFTEEDESTLSLEIYRQMLNRGQYIRVLGKFICVAPPLISSEKNIKKLFFDLSKVLERT